MDYYDAIAVIIFCAIMYPLIGFQAYKLYVGQN